MSLGNEIQIIPTSQYHFPEWWRGLESPEAEFSGQWNYEINSLWYAIHEGVKAEDRYKVCKDFGLDRFPGIHDLHQLQIKGRDFSRKYFGSGFVLVAWRSVSWDKEGQLWVPYLCERGGVAVGWLWLGNMLHAYHKQLYFRG